MSIHRNEENSLYSVRIPHLTKYDSSSQFVSFNLSVNVINIFFTLALLRDGRHISCTAPILKSRCMFPFVLLFFKDASGSTAHERNGSSVTWQWRFNYYKEPLDKDTCSWGNAWIVQRVSRSKMLTTLVVYKLYDCRYWRLLQNLRSLEVRRRPELEED